MSPKETIITEQISEIFVAKGMTPPDMDESTFIDGSLGLESLDFAELAVRLESHFGHDPFAEPSVPALRTIADLAALYA